jgi:hypothetical protein
MHRAEHTASFSPNPDGYRTFLAETFSPGRRPGTDFLTAAGLPFPTLIDNDMKFCTFSETTQYLKGFSLP